jgi:superfamily II DNA/RNA helicase
MARGMDVSNVDFVVSYDLPKHFKTYIHRIGRTARAGRQGTALALLTRGEVTGVDVFCTAFYCCLLLQQK